MSNIKFKIYKKSNSICVEIKDIYDIAVEKLSFNTPTVISIRQYTGLIDKHGNEIYSGDILFDSIRAHKFKVFDVPGGFAVNTHQEDLNRNTPFYTGLSDMQNSSWIQSLEIIGNIYQHKNLLTNPLNNN